MIENILIVRPSSIGDIVMASPMLPTLRAAYPKARIAWLVEPGMQDLLTENPYLDRVIPWPKREWTALLKKGRLFALAEAILAFSKGLRQQRFDLALDGQGLLRSRLLAWLSGARERVGLDSKEPGRFLMTRVVSRGPRNNRMSSEYLHLMRELGLRPPNFHPALATSKKNEARAEEILSQAGVRGGYIAFCPFSTRPQKHWVEDRWAELARRVGDRFGLPVVIMGGPGDLDAAQRIHAAAQGRTICLAGATSLGESAAIIRRAALVIGVDTGLTHMGIAFDRPTIPLFGATRPYLQTEGSQVEVLYHPRSCSPCRRTVTCGDEFPCMKDIAVEEVFRAAEALGPAGQP